MSILKMSSTNYTSGLIDKFKFKILIDNLKHIIIYITCITVINN